MYSIDFAEDIWARGIERDYCMTPVLQAVCNRWEAAMHEWAERYIR